MRSLQSFIDLTEKKQEDFPSFVVRSFEHERKTEIVGETGN